MPKEVESVVLTGGVFANSLLTSGVMTRLKRLDIPVFAHQRIPGNDGGLSLGRLTVAAARDGGTDQMCLGIPGRVVALYQDLDMRMAKVQFGGITKAACLEHVPDARVGDYVVVHVGFALSRIDEAEAMRVFEFLREMDQLDDLKAPAA